MVTRMTEQKGFDLVACVLDELMGREEMQFMLLGSGEERFENFMRAAEYRYKGRVCSYIGYHAELANLIYAGSDFPPRKTARKTVKRRTPRAIRTKRSLSSRSPTSWPTSLTTP